MDRASAEEAIMCVSDVFQRICVNGGDVFFRSLLIGNNSATPERQSGHDFYFFFFFRFL
jgi:hypothetical protein